MSSEGCNSSPPFCAQLRNIGIPLKSSGFRRFPFPKMAKGPQKIRNIDEEEPNHQRIDGHIKDDAGTDHHTMPSSGHDTRSSEDPV